MEYRRGRITVSRRALCLPRGLPPQRDRHPNRPWRSAHHGLQFYRFPALARADQAMDNAHDNSNGSSRNCRSLGGVPPVLIQLIEEGEIGYPNRTVDEASANGTVPARGKSVAHRQPVHQSSGNREWAETVDGSQVQRVHRQMVNFPNHSGGMGFGSYLSTARHCHVDPGAWLQLRGPTLARSTTGKQSSAENGNAAAQHQSCLASATACGSDDTMRATGPPYKRSFMRVQ